MPCALLFTSFQQCDIFAVCRLCSCRAAWCCVIVVTVTVAVLHSLMHVRDLCAWQHPRCVQSAGDALKVGKDYAVGAAGYLGEARSLPFTARYVCLILRVSSL